MSRRAALAWLSELGYISANGLDIGPDGDKPERASYGDVLLIERLRKAIASKLDRSRSWFRWSSPPGFGGVHHNKRQALVRQSLTRIGSRLPFSSPSYSAKEGKLPPRSNLRWRGQIVARWLAADPVIVLPAATAPNHQVLKKRSQTANPLQSGRWHLVPHHVSRSWSPVPQPGFCFVRHHIIQLRHIQEIPPAFEPHDDGRRSAASHSL